MPGRVKAYAPEDERGRVAEVLRYVTVRGLVQSDREDDRKRIDGDGGDETV